MRALMRISKPRAFGRLALFCAALAVLFSVQTWAQSDGTSLGGSGQRGADLGALLDAFGDETGSSLTAELPCRTLLAAGPTLVDLTCLLDAIEARLGQGSDQGSANPWPLITQVFATRFADRPTWPTLEAALDVRAATGQAGVPPQESAAAAAGASFAALATNATCPPLAETRALLPDQTKTFWQSTPEGLRDLAPPLVTQETVKQNLLRQALLHPEPHQIFLATACTDVRLPLARALFQTHLAFGELDRAEALADLPFMPRRYARQILGARGEGTVMDAARAQAAQVVLDRQRALASPGAASAEVAIILDEIERQFTIDFIMGRLWTLNRAGLLELEADSAFVSQVARLLSQDARLIQQGYAPLEVRLFYQDFFELVVEKEAFALLDGLDLLVPEVMQAELAVALSARPLNAASPTRFERDQEVLALLIRSGETEPVLGVWQDLSAVQRRDAVLFAADQQAFAAASQLYANLDPGDMSPDFLIRLALYMAYVLPSFEEETDLPLDIGIEVIGDAGQGAG